MNEVEYVLRIVLQARDQLAGALKKAREELRLFVNAIDSHKAKIDAFNTSIKAMDENVENVTNKFKDWRAVMEGTAGENAKAKKSFGDLGREVDSTAKAQNRNADAQIKAARAQEELNRSANRLRSQYEKLSKQEQDDVKKRDFAILKYRQIGRELENLAKKVEDTDLGVFWTKWARDAKLSADFIVHENEKVIESQKQVVKSEEEAATNRQRIRDRDASARAAFARTFAVREKISGGGDRDFIDIAEAKQTVTVLRQVAKGYDDNSKMARRLRGEAERLNAELRNTGKEGRNTSGVFRTLFSELRNNSDSIATLDNQFRGLGLLTIIGFAQQLITVLGGLAGSLFSVAASAAEAAAALGGMATAGIAEAIPVIGLLGAALFQAKGAMDAMKQAQLERQQQSVQGQGADRRSADAADAVAAAHKRLKDAQIALTKARKDGQRELEDLIQAENDAKLAAIGAALSQKEAQQALIKAQATGDTAGIQRAQLQLLQAQSDAQDSLTQKKRADADADKARAGGVEGLPSVQHAAEQVKAAQRGIQTAKRNADEAAQGTETAGQKLQFLLSQMTKGQVALFHALEALRKVYLENFGPISDIILGSFTRVVNRITELLKSSEILDAAKSLSKEIRDQLNRITDSFLGDKMIAQFLRIAEQARTNLKPVTDIIINLGKAFFNIAEAAGPSFHKFLGYISDLVGKFADLTGNKDKMTDFFNTGEKHLEAWLDLIGAVIGLFMALAGAGGAESGLGMVEDLTKAIQGLTDWVDTHREDVVKFFDEARGVAEEVLGVIVALAKELFKAFTPERVDNFANLIKDVILPALGDVVNFLGDATAKLVAFSETPVGGEILKAVVAFFVLSKVLSGVLGSFKAFGTFLTPIVKAFFNIAKEESVFTKIVQGFLDLAESGAGAEFGTIALRFLGIVGAVVALLQWLGLLDDAWDEVKSGFMAFWKEVEPSLGKLFKSFKELWKVVSEGKGLFGILRAVLRPLVKALLDIGGIFLRVFGRALGRIIGGAIDILTGIITFLTEIFQGHWRKAWNALKDIVRGFFRILGGIFRAFPELILEIAKKILPAFKKGINALWDWLKGMPKRLGDIASEAAHAFTHAFHNVGGDIIKGIVSGLKSGVGFAKDIANSFIDLLNHLLPNKIAVPGAPDINLPNNPIPHLAAGGPVPGSGRGDRIHALLEAGEHVLTRQEVAAMGGHGAVFALRRALGGGGQGSGGRFAAGGAAVAGGLTVSFQGGGLDDFRSTWRQFWTALVLITRQGSNLVESQFRDMRTNTTRSADRMYRDIRSSVSDIQNSFKVRGDKVVSSWADMWDSIKKVTHDGLFYIGHETNKALHGLGEKHIDFGLSAPQKSDGKAGGGWIGNKGQRGRDMGFYPLGAGEAVLNWQHQKYIEPAMNAYYGHGLSSMFDRVRGYHAGGSGQAGFAGGRSGVAALFDGHPSNVVSGIIDLVRLLKKKFPGLLVTSTRDHGTITSTGGLSDHPSGHAVDLASADYGLMNRAAAYIKSSGIAKKLKQGIHDPNLAINQGQTVSGPGFFAGAWPQHLNHIHLAMAGALGRVADMITNIAKQTVEGPDGGLKSIMQSAIDTVRKAANKFIDDKSTAGADAAGMPGGPGTPAPKGQHRKWIIAGLRLAGVPITEGNISAQYTLDMGESGGVAKIVQQVHDINSVTGNLARGIAQVIPPTFNTYKVPGHGDIDNPVDNIAASAKYQIARYGHLVGHSGYARGGEIPGQPGAPVPILAHAREWVLNLTQQARLAQLLGMSRTGLRSMLGFHGPSHTAQGGTEATEIAPLTPKEVKGIDSPQLRRMVRALRKLSASFAEASTQIGSVEEWSGVLHAGLLNLDQVTKRLKAKNGERKKKDTDFDRGIFAFVDAVDGMLTDTTGMFAKLRASIERRASVLARRLLRRQFTVDHGVVSRADLGTEEVAQQAIAGRDLAEERRQRTELVRERNRISGALRRVRRQQGRAGLSDAQKTRLQTEENQLQAMLDDAKQRVTDNISSIYEAQQTYLQAQLATQQAITDGITHRYDLANASIDRQKREATARGDDKTLANLSQQTIDNLGSLANEINSRIAATKAIGTKEALDAAEQMSEQVKDLRTQIIEAVAQAIKDDVDNINTRAQRRLSHLDLGGRLLDALGVVGVDQRATLGFGGVAQSLGRSGISAARGQVLQDQSRDLTGQRDRALREHNNDLVNSLNDQLAELTVQIAENNKAQFDAKNEAVNARANLAITQSDLRTQIAQLTGQISGNTDQAALLAEATIKATALQEQRTGLQAQLYRLTHATGIKNQAAIDDLTTQLLQNELAILQNTQATDELTGNLSKDQGFTSTAFEVFSQAIFTGSGGLLPMYQNLFPSAAVGADVINGGMLMAHAGEKIIPAKVAALNGGAGNMGDTNYFDIDINEAGRPIDWAGAATAIMFKKSGAK